MPAITEYLNLLLDGQNLTFDQAQTLQDTIFDGGVDPAQIAAFLTAMRIKGATAPELAGLAKSLRDHAVPVNVKIDNLVDTCGTGGARLKTFNISTAAAIVAAGAGAQRRRGRHRDGAALRSTRGPWPGPPAARGRRSAGGCAGALARGTHHAAQAPRKPRRPAPAAAASRAARAGPGRARGQIGRAHV